MKCRMIGWLRNRLSLKHRANDIYGAVVAIAGTPLFYNQMGVADTPEGRYEILVLHLFLIMERLRFLGDEGLKLSQELIDRFIIDIDDNMREMGVGDLTVPRKVKKAAAAYYDRVEVYRLALVDADTEAIAIALANVVPSSKICSLDLKALSNHALRLHKALSEQSAKNISNFLIQIISEIRVL